MKMASRFPQKESFSEFWQIYFLSNCDKQRSDDGKNGTSQALKFGSFFRFYLSVQEQM